MLEQCAGRLIGRDPQYIERLWQDMSRAFFYPPGREKVDALGALDLALWDIKGKVQKMPVHQVLGGMVRNYCECYNTAGSIPGITARHEHQERARLTVEAGYRAFRMGAADTPANTTFNTHERLNKLYDDCVQAREGVGKNGDWCVDFHQRFDLIDADPRLQPDRESGSLLRGRSRCAPKRSWKTSRSCGARPRCPSRPARNGATAGTSTSWWSITTSTTCAPRCPTSAASPR